MASWELFSSSSYPSQNSYTITETVNKSEKKLKKNKKENCWIYSTLCVYFTLQEQLRDPHVDQEILESIEETYYSSEDFDTSEYELKVSSVFKIFMKQFYYYFDLKYVFTKPLHQKAGCDTRSILAVVKVV